MKKFFFTAVAFIYLTVAAWAYGPVGNGVYKGFIINNNTNRYMVVEVVDDSGVIVFQKQINPKRPVKMPFKKHGKDNYIPDNHAYKDLLEKYYSDNGKPLWIEEVYLYPEVAYTLKFRYSDDKKFKEETFLFFKEDAKEGPYLIEIE